MTEITEQDIEALEMLYNRRLELLKFALGRLVQRPDDLGLAQKALKQCRNAYNGWQVFKNLKEYQDNRKLEKEGEE